MYKYIIYMCIKILLCMYVINNISKLSQFILYASDIYMCIIYISIYVYIYIYICIYIYIFIYIYKHIYLCLSANSMTPGTNVFWGDPLIYVHPSRIDATANIVEGETCISMCMCVCMCL